MNETTETLQRAREVVQDCQEIIDTLVNAITDAEKAVKSHWLEMQDSAKRSMEVYEGMKLESHPN
jgi:hypothetical protein